MTKPSPIRRPKPCEEGYTLISVIFMVALMSLSLSIAMPKVIEEIQRDREQETMQRGKQYMRGVRMYYRKFGAYPPNADALIKGTTDMHFMRKKYADLTMGTTDWKPVYLGQNKAPLAMGFFGVPLGGPVFAGNIPGASTNGIQAASSVATQSTGGDPNASNSGTAGNTSAFGETGQTFGGAGIIGFSPNSPKQSIMVYKTKTHYNEWEFVYSPLLDQMPQGAAPVGVPLQPGAPGFSPQSSTSSTTNTISTPTTPH